MSWEMQAIPGKFNGNKLRGDSNHRPYQHIAELLNVNLGCKTNYQAKCMDLQRAAG